MVVASAGNEANAAGQLTDPAMDPFVVPSGLRTQSGCGRVESADRHELHKPGLRQTQGGTLDDGQRLAGMERQARGRWVSLRSFGWQPGMARVFLGDRRGEW